MTDNARAGPVVATDPVVDAVRGLEASFLAAAAGEPEVYEYEMAGSPIAIRFAGRKLVKTFGPAFAHLTRQSSDRSTPATLTVNMWDSASNHSPLPPRPSAPEEYARGAMFHVDEGSIRAVYEPGTEALSVFDSSAGVAWYWVRDVSQVPYWDRASPMRQMLFWWLHSRGYLQVHGSAVGTPNGGALIVGRRGSGKSVTSLASLGSSLLFAADDYSAVSMEAPYHIASIYSSGKLVPEQGEKLLPHLMPLASNPRNFATEKAVIFAHEHFPSQTTSGFPLRAILVPTVCPLERESRVIDVPRTSAFAALAPSTIVQLRTAKQDVLTTLSELVRRVPAFGIELGTDTAAIPQVIHDFLASLESRESS